MGDKNKTKDQLLQELSELQKSVAELKKIETERKQTEKQLRNERQKFSTLAENAPLGMIMIDRNGKFTYINPKFKEIFGYDLSDIPDGKIWFRKAYPDPEYRHTTISAWLSNLEGSKPGEKRPRVFTVTCKDGTKKMANFISVQMETGEQIVSCDDVTKRMQAEDALRESEDRYRRITEGLTDYLYTVRIRDGQAVETRHSKACEVVTGYTAEEFAFDPYLWIQMVVAEDRDQVVERVQKILGGEAIQPIEHRIVRKDGQIRWVSDTTIQQFDPQMRLISYDGVIKDITERKRYEKSLRASEERFRRLLESVTDYIYTVKIEAGRPIATSHGPGSIMVTGYTSEEYESDPELWYRMIHEEDRQAVTEQAAKVLSGKEVLPLEHRLIHKDGSIRWVRNTPVPRYDDQGRLVAYDGLIADITDRKRIEESFKEGEHRFRELYDNAPVGYHEFNKEGIITRVNQTELDMMGYILEEMIGQPVWKFIVAEEITSQSILAKLAGDLPLSKSFECTCQRKDGSTFPVLIEDRLFKNEKGQVVGIRSTIQDITELKRMEEQLHIMSIIDDLTNLYNRRGFFTLSLQQMKIVERARKDMLLFFADLDNMKHINDTLGHQEGDKALVEVATILKETFRESDIIGRIGGDEFAILAIDTPEETREVLINRLHKSLDTYNRLEGRNYMLSLSIGIAHYDPENPSSLDELMVRADTLMYEEKRKKQN